MHSYFIRANLIFFFFLTCLFFLSVGCSLTALFHNPTIPISITNHRILRLAALDHPHMRGEQAVLSFDADIDLRPVWNWNVKQAFVWIAVDFPTPTRQHNSILLWDQILTHPNQSHIVKKELVSEARTR